MKYKNNINRLTVSAPGRICLFGEHQDYLGLPVIAAAINKRIVISGKRRNDNSFHLELPDIDEVEDIKSEFPIKYIYERDYFRSCLNILYREGIKFNEGYDCWIQGNIPINAGTSSSSALTVAWIQFLLGISSDNRKNDTLEVARLAHRAEVLEFNEPGGMMDQYTASFGHVLYIDFSNPAGPERLPTELGTFVLGDSLEPKDTRGLLAHVKGGTLEAVNILKQKDDKLNISTITFDDLDRYRSIISKGHLRLLKGNIINRGLTQEAKELLNQKSIDHKKLGGLLNDHQVQLRDNLGISTPKIDRMINAAVNSGALGAKINGSGGGGCMFAYAPDNHKQVAEAIAAIGGKPYIITVDKGIGRI